MHADVEEEFRAFVRSRWPRLVSTAYLLTGDLHHAEDVAQTALTKAYRSWNRVRRSDNPDAYVRRILVTSHKDRFRKRRVAERLTDALPDVADGRDPLSASEQRQELMAALATLSSRQRTVVVLRYWEDIPEAEVAQALGCSVGTVKSQASRALARLRGALRESPTVFAAQGEERKNTR
ncbi:SigE family RNA polymerase sigma factor [Streptomyces aidingensis]|uniref:RNA polymerase sigma-70 factor, sigma-E family n=1 Tax=Streptomyces aidingensis TaxID=910347 RepID=A0A1I1EK67_9ACTN|nr:SigE family RNA polymerase sigma factor [Streptomyces aidingensis]SFB87022.1 RNA polymerase sigma-70 factor, sigma-E family [Streptomyces aidingensis]